MNWKSVWNLACYNKSNTDKFHYLMLLWRMYCLQGTDGHKKPNSCLQLTPLSKAGRSGWVPDLGSLSHLEGSEGQGSGRNNLTDRSRGIRLAQENMLGHMKIAVKWGEVVTSLNNSYMGDRLLNEYKSLPPFPATVLLCWQSYPDSRILA